MTNRLMLVAAAIALSGWATHVRADVMDGVNQNAAPSSGGTWSATEVGWFYTPSVSYSLSGIDTKFFSTDGRTVTLEFFKNGPRADAGWQLLGTADVLASASPTWSVGTFPTQIGLTAGDTYFVGFRNTQKLPTGEPGVVTLLGLNVTEFGTTLTHRFGWTGTGLYDMSFQSSPSNQPILRFNGTPPGVVPEAGTLTALAGLLSGGGLFLLRRRR